MTVYTKVDHNNHLSQCLPSCEDNVINPAKRLLKTLEVWIDRVRQRRQLATLDDRMLKDIGITRIEANREIAKPFWRDN